MRIVYLAPSCWRTTGPNLCQGQNRSKRKLSLYPYRGHPEGRSQR